MRMILTDSRSDSRIGDFIDRGRAAQERFAQYSQDQVDEVVTAVAWSGYHNADLLARLAVDETAIGNVADKLTKTRRKILGTLRDLKGAPSVGVIRVDERRGLTEIAKPAGIVAAFTPMTNPSATVVNNLMIALKGANAVIVAPHPSGERTCAEAVRLARVEIAKTGAPVDLIQYVSLRAADKAESKRRADELMRAVDLVLATAGRATVSAAYSSGRPALGVGVGNVPVIVDSTADLDDAATKIAYSKTFDNATSCSSENALVVEATVYDALVGALQAHGGYVLTRTEVGMLERVMWHGAMLNREIVGQPASLLVSLSGISSSEARQARFLVVEETGVGPEFPFSGEKLSPVLALYKVHDFGEAVEHVNSILAYQGLGHSCGIHTKDNAHVDELAARVKVCRVLVNQAHCVGNGGDFANGLKFSLSMAAGTWGRNSTSDNISYEHLLNITRVARPIPPVVPSEGDLFGDFLKRYPS
jgi:sulfoacetaldehyde dehydrogenase